MAASNASRLRGLKDKQRMDIISQAKAVARSMAQKPNEPPMQAAAKQVAKKPTATRTEIRAGAEALVGGTRTNTSGNARQGQKFQTISTARGTVHKYDNGLKVFVPGKPKDGDANSKLPAYGKLPKHPTEQDTNEGQRLRKYTNRSGNARRGQSYVKQQTPRGMAHVYSDGTNVQVNRKRKPKRFDSRG